MKEYTVVVRDRPGELARVTEALAASAVNITAIASEGAHEECFLRIVTNDVNTTNRALKAVGLRFKTSDLLVVDLIDRPGELAKVAKRLAKASVNVQSIYLLGSKDGRTQLGMVVDDLEKAKRLV